MKTHGLLVGLLLLWSCGETARKPSGTTPSDGGDGGQGANSGTSAGSSSGGAVMTSAGEGGLASLAGQGGSLVAGAGGDGGAVDDAFGLLTVPPLLPESFRARAAPSMELYAGTQPLVISRDGSRILGTVEGQIVDPGVSTESELFVFTWSEAGGTVLLDSDGENALSGRACLSDDGSILFGLRPLNNEPTSYVPYRWTEANGQESLGFDFLAGTETALGMSCSRDGSVVALQVYVAPLTAALALFISGKNQDRFTQVELPNVTDSISDARLSGDGSTLFVTTLDAQAEQNTIYRAARADGFATLEPLVNATGFARCQLSLVNDDASILYGLCEEPGNLRGFRYTTTSQKMELSPKDLAQPQFMTDDGSLVLGARGNGQISALAGGEPLELLSEHEEWVALDNAGPGPVAYANRSPVPGFTEAQQFSVDAGFVALPPAPGVVSSRLLGVSIEGSVAFGYSPVDFNAEHDVLWDARGVRDLRKELQKAGVDLRGYQRMFPAQINVHEHVRVIGTSNSPESNGLTQTFVAKLPRR